MIKWLRKFLGLKMPPAIIPIPKDGWVEEKYNGKTVIIKKSQLDWWYLRTPAQKMEMINYQKKLLASKQIEIVETPEGKRLVKK